MTDTLSLLRRWVNDYFNRHAAAAARDFIAADYALSIGDVIFAGRDDAWLPAVDAQFRAWPGMGMTVHRTLAGDGWAAVWFSEHGQSGGRQAVWSGVGIYRGDGQRLTGCIAQEDYYTRRRQVKDGRADTPDRPALAPWDTPPAPANPAAEARVRDWLTGDWPRPEDTVACDDDHITGNPLRFAVTGCAVREMLSSGDQVAFSVRQTGTYLGGLPVEARQAQTLDVNGIVDVTDGRIAGGRVIRDRIGLWSRLREAA